MTQKKQHDIAVMLRRIARAVENYPKAAMFELAEQGFSTTFQQLVGCMPCDFDVLTSLPGVGRKCANLTLGIACK
jgi:endonuclease III